MGITSFFNQEIFLLFLGGIFSLSLTVVIIFVRQEYKRQFRREQLRDQARVQPEAVGDIEAKLNDEIPSYNIFELFTLYGLQPLFIINFINLFHKHSIIETSLAFALTLFTILHEFWSGLLFSKNKKYQFLLLILWIGLFLLMSYRTNNNFKEEIKTQTVTFSDSSSYRTVSQLNDKKIKCDSGQFRTDSFSNGTVTQNKK